MKQKIYEIPGKLTVEWEDQLRAIIDTWTNYFITLEQFKEAVMNNGVNHAAKNRVRAWIVDSSGANGAFAKEIQDYIGSTCFPKFAQIGVKHFITIAESKNAITQMSIKSYSAKTGPNGLQLVEVNSLENALQWLTLH